ncbi:MAG: histidinol dehydrogenase [Fimbriimonadaceae bacterium]|nr:histidinol dehydrogenase [Fimbriimonadaceae bacterium]
MRILDNATAPEAVRALLARDVFAGTGEHAQQAAAIVQDVRERGDAAVLEYTRRFDCADFRADQMRVAPAAIKAARNAVPPAFLNAVAVAVGNLTDFHRRQVRQDWFAPRPGGGWVGQRFTPVQAVGAYVPGGQAVLPSTLLHVCVPAQVAGVERLAVCCPPRADGCGEPHLLAAAAIIGIDEIYLIGGAQAIAALAYGTATVPRVDLVAGPGNPWVNHAKRLVFGVVGIDSLAGPSEILVIADDSADPRQIAADLLSQAEHSADARAILLTPSRALATAVAAEVELQLTALDSPTARQALEAVGGIVLTADLDEACALASLCAPEHLEILVPEPSRLLGRVRHAGAVFLGEHSPEPLGDYVAGPSHVLPTGGTARFASPLGVDTFVKKSSLVCYERESLANEAPAILTLARAEGLEAHARSIEARLD